MTQIQNFESFVATIVCSLSSHGNEEIEDEEAAMAYYDNLLDEFDNKTLGRLIALIKQNVAGNELHDRLMNVKMENIIEEIQEAQSLLISELSAQNVTHISSVYVNLDTGEIMAQMASHDFGVETLTVLSKRFSQRTSTKNEQ